MKFISQVTVTGGPRLTPPQRVVTLVKNTVIRTDTERITTLYDVKNQTITTLNRSDKTYRIISLNNALGRTSGVLSKVKFATTATINPQDETRVIAGKPARKYSGKITMQLLTPGMSAETAPQTTMELEQWTTEAVTLPAGTQAMLSPVMRLAGPLQKMEGMQPVVEALSRIKGAPLSSKVTVIPAAKGSEPRDPIVTINEVLSVTSAPLSASLFQIPRDYKKVEVRAFPSLPKRSTPSRDH